MFGVRKYQFALLCLWGLSACDSRTSLEALNTSTDVDPGSEITDAGTVAEDDQYGDAYWAELAQEYPAFVAPPEFAAAHDAEENINLGRWGDVIEWPQIATGAAQLPDGRLLTWSSTAESGFGGNTAFTHGSIFDPLTESFTDQPNTDHNMFCSGISMLADGSVFTAGGGKTVTTTSLFKDGEWSLTDSLNVARWYPQSTTLASGQVVTSLGSKNTAFSELWTAEQGWRTLPGANLQSVLDDTSAENNLRSWFPALNVAPDGSLFHPGPTSELFSLDLYTNGASITSHGKRESGDPHRLYNTTVMYDIGKMLIAGGGKPALNTALTIDINGSTPVVTPTSPMTYARSMQDSIVLPNGKVLVIGGNSSGVQFSDEGTQLVPEIWDPQTGEWQSLAPHSKPRNYHSTAVLLKDGRVAAMGSGLCGNCATNQQNGEIFEPPYLFNADGTRATQPQIATGPEDAGAGDVLSFSASAGLQSFSMVRLVALTHHHTTDQRFIPLEFTETSAGNYSVQLPANNYVLVPGYYWVFGLDANGVPSEGHTLMVNTTVAEVPEPPATLTYDYYEGQWNALPDFDSLTPVASGETDGFSLSEKQSDNFFGFRYAATVNLPDTGSYTFYTSSDDGSQLFINGGMVVDNDGLHAAEEEQGSVVLDAGSHDLVVTYFEKTGGNSLSVQVQGPSFSKQAIEAFLEPLDTAPEPEPEPEPEGLLDNGAFSNDLSGWSVCGGQAAASAGAAVLSAGGCIYQEFTAVPRANYKVTCDAGAPTGYASVQLGVSDASYVTIASDLTAVTSGTMTPFVASVTAPDSSAHGVITLYAEQQASFDNCVITVDDTGVMPVTVEPAGNELLVNPDFASGLDSWSACGGAQTVTTDGIDNGNAVSLSGSGCLFQEFTVTPGAQYDLACLGKSVEDYTSVSLTTYDSAYVPLDSQEVVVTNSGSYQNNEIAITALGNAQYGVVTLYADTDASFDSCGVVVTGGVTPEPFNPVDPAANLLSNGDFSNADGNWLSCGGESAIAAAGIDGSDAMTLTGNGCVYQEFNVVAGSDYEVRCRGSASGYASLSLGFSDVDYGFLADNEATVSGSALSGVELSVTAPVAAVRGSVTLYADESAVFDDCGVVEN